MTKLVCVCFHVCETASKSWVASHASLNTESLEEIVLGCRRVILLLLSSPLTHNFLSYFLCLFSDHRPSSHFLPLVFKKESILREAIFLFRLLIPCQFIFFSPIFSHSPETEMSNTWLSELLSFIAPTGCPSPPSFSSLHPSFQFLVRTISCSFCQSPCQFPYMNKCLHLFVNWNQSINKADIVLKWVLKTRSYKFKHSIKLMQFLRPSSWTRLILCACVCVCMLPRDI